MEETIRFTLNGKKTELRNNPSHTLVSVTWSRNDICRCVGHRKIEGIKVIRDGDFIAVGAAVANAIHDVTGARLYRTPMTPERVMEAIRKA